MRGPNWNEELRRAIDRSIRDQNEQIERAQQRQLEVWVTIAQEHRQDELQAHIHVCANLADHFGSSRAGLLSVLLIRFRGEQQNYDVQFGSLSIGNMIAGAYGASNANFSITSTHLMDDASRLKITPSDLVLAIAGHNRRGAELQVTRACD